MRLAFDARKIAYVKNKAIQTDRVINFIRLYKIRTKYPPDGQSYLDPSVIRVQTFILRFINELTIVISSIDEGLQPEEK